MKGLITILAVLLVAGLAFFLYSTPTAPPEMTDAEIAQHEAEVRQEITSMVDSWKDALMRGDVGAIMSLYTPGVRVYYPGMSLDRDELRAFLEESVQAATTTGVDLTSLDLFVHGDAAYFIFEVSETFQMEGQESETNISNCFTRLVKEDNAWKADREVCAPRDAPAEG